jgi:Asp-tRNA(Asn)/Glu-tRNA(Gln) amidotransferase C subunit
MAQEGKAELSPETLLQVAAYAGLPLKREQAEEQQTQLGDTLEHLKSVGEEALRGVEPAYIRPMRRERRRR